MEILLDDNEVRILGCLIEKEMTTPDYYPLSLNALVSACNQKSNRNPVVTFDEATVEQGIGSLLQKGLVRLTHASGSRVPKYLHAFLDRFDLSGREMAVLCELMVRGPQTAGELRTHAGRITPIERLEAIDTILQTLMDQAPPLVVRLEREHGRKERRYIHLLSGMPSAEEKEPRPLPGGIAPAPAQEERIARIEEELRQVREELDEMRTALEGLRSRS
jgi:uncharacterized protein YceH (UPF0502 family)